MIFIEIDIFSKVIVLFTEHKDMRVILFDECENIASKLGNVLKEKYRDIKIYTNLLYFLESVFNNDDDTIFIISESVLKTRNIKISYILKRFDCCEPIITYNISSDICLNLDINYIYEYQKNNYQVFMEDIYNIESCFDTFVSDKEYFSSHNFYVREVPIYLHIDGKNNKPHNLYEITNVQRNSDIMSYLTKMQAKLFVLLLSHTDGITLSDISCNLWGNDGKSKAQNVYTLIHELGRIISQKTSNKYQIIHQKKKYHLVQNKDISTGSDPHGTSFIESTKTCSSAK